MRKETIKPSAKLISNWLISESSFDRTFGLGSIMFLTLHPKDKDGHAIMLEVLENIELHKYPEMWDSSGIQKTFVYDTTAMVYEELKKWKKGGEAK